MPQAESRNDESRGLKVVQNYGFASVGELLTQRTLRYARNDGSGGMQSMQGYGLLRYARNDGSGRRNNGGGAC